MEKMFGLICVVFEILDVFEVMDLIVGNGEVEFRDVEFLYDFERFILKCVLFVVLGGKKVVVVGLSGVGKLIFF